MAPMIKEKMDDNSFMLGESLLFPGPSNIASTIWQTRTAWFMSCIGLQFGVYSGLEAASLRPPSILSPVERQTRVLQFVAQLR